MKIKFQNRLEAIDWIAKFVEDEGQFEILREQLNFNQIYTGIHYLNIDEKELEMDVVFKKIFQTSKKSMNRKVFVNLLR
jgi:hypothetical protein